MNFAAGLHNHLRTQNDVEAFDDNFSLNSRIENFHFYAAAVENRKQNKKQLEMKIP